MVHSFHLTQTVLHTSPLYVRQVKTYMLKQQGNYHVTLSASPSTAPESYAPFLSLNKRQSIFTEHTQLQCAPGPGRYDPGVPSVMFKGGWSHSQVREAVTLTFAYHCCLWDTSVMLV